MRDLINIQWEDAVSSNHFQRQIKHPQAMLEEFIDSNKELFCLSDYQYYADETGKSIETLLDIASTTG